MLQPGPEDLSVSFLILIIWFDAFVQEHSFGIGGPEIIKNFLRHIEVIIHRAGDINNSKHLKFRLVIIFSDDG